MKADLMVVDVRPDPRLSSLPPAWLPRRDWRQWVDPLTDTDVEWIEQQWQMATEGSTDDA